MAKYTINHTCGHSREVQLFGKNIERERKIEWMESQKCPKCWGEKKRAEEAKLPITATIKINVMDTDKDGNMLAEIVLTGGTINKKEQIKSMGYGWGEARGGVLDMLSTSKPDQAWIKIVPLMDLADGTKTQKIIMEELESIDAIIKNGIDPISYQMAIDKMAENEQIKTAIESLQKPELPESLPSKRGKWHGKIYGNEKYGYRVYIDGDEEKITNSEAEEIKNYLINREKYNMAIEKIKRGE
jgi:hypothetical protein